jgi:hypothetical protein
MTSLLVSSAQATVNDEQVTIQMEDDNKQNCSRYNEVLAILIVAGIVGGMFWYCYGLFGIDARLLKPIDFDAFDKELAELRSLLQNEAVALVNRNF